MARKPAIKDSTVARALAAYESLPLNSGRFRRILAALEAVAQIPAFELNGKPQHPDIKENS